MARERHEQRELFGKDWYAPAGSPQEEKILRGWAKVSKKDRRLIDQWISNPNELVERDLPFWRAAKKSVLGEVVYEAAMDRQGRLDDEHWLVAYFIAQSIEEEEIEELMHLRERRVADIIRDLKDIIAQDYGCRIEIKNRVQIARWFLGS